MARGTSICPANCFLNSLMVQIQWAFRRFRLKAEEEDNCPTNRIYQQEATLPRAFFSWLCEEHTSCNGPTTVQSSVNPRAGGTAQQWVGLAGFLTPTSNTAFPRGPRLISSEEQACVLSRGSPLFLLPRVSRAWVGWDGHRPRALREPGQLHSTPCATATLAGIWRTPERVLDKGSPTCPFPLRKS